MFAAIVLGGKPPGQDPTPLLWLPLALGYFAVVTALLHALKSTTDRGALASAGAFFVCVIAYLIVPAVFVPQRALPPVVVMGWSYMLGAYSYFRHTAASRRRHDLGDGLFFVLINPTLVYSARGRRIGPPRIDAKALSRVAAGLLFWAAQHLWTGWVSAQWAAAVPVSMFDLTNLGAYLSTLGYFLSAALGFYLAHSGLASIQIGLMRMTGWEVPECYRYPFLSKSPGDFWTRWNLWVQTWAKVHVFVPLARHMLRTKAPLVRHSARPVSLVCTFAIVGALHDLALHAMGVTSPSAQPFSATAMFVVFAVIAMIWHGIVAALKALPHPSRTIQDKLQPLQFVCSWILFVQIACFMQSLAMPVLAGRGLPRWFVDLF